MLPVDAVPWRKSARSIRVGVSGIAGSSGRAAPDVPEASEDWGGGYIVRISENLASAPRLSATGRPSSLRTMLVPCTSATIL